MMQWISLQFVYSIAQLCPTNSGVMGTLIQNKKSSLRPFFSQFIFCLTSNNSTSQNIGCSDTKANPQRWEDEMVRERTGHSPSFAKAKK